MHDASRRTPTAAPTRLRTLALGPLLTGAIVASVCASARPARADDVSTAVYNDVKTVIEDLIRQQVGRDLATYIRTQTGPVGPALAFYFKGALVRLEANQWSNVPSALHDGIVDLITDAFYWYISGHGLCPAATPNCVLDPKSAVPGQSGNFSLWQFLSAAGSRYTSSGASSWVTAECIKTSHNAMLDPFACDAVLGVKAEIFGKRSEAKSYLRDVLTDLFVRGVAGSDNQSAELLFESWMDHPAQVYADAARAMASTSISALAKNGKTDCSAVSLANTFVPGTEPTPLNQACLAWDFDAVTKSEAVRMRIMVDGSQLPSWAICSMAPSTKCASRRPRAPFESDGRTASPWAARPTWKCRSARSRRSPPRRGPILDRRSSRSTIWCNSPTTLASARRRPPIGSRTSGY